MNKRFLLVLPMLVGSCIGRHSAETPAIPVQEVAVVPELREVDTVFVDLQSSKIQWKGTKMRGAGKHEGEIRLESAYFLRDQESVKGGQFMVDMNSISITDIPAHETIPLKNLNDHLRDKDFFNVAEYPTSQFVITKTELLTKDSLLVTGNLTMKGITHGIRFKALNTPDQFRAVITFDRYNWDIAYTGSWADKTLVDRDVTLTINLKLHSRFPFK